MKDVQERIVQMDKNLAFNMKELKKHAEPVIKSNPDIDKCFVAMFSTQLQKAHNQASQIMGLLKCICESGVGKEMLPLTSYEHYAYKWLRELIQKDLTTRMPEASVHHTPQQELTRKVYYYTDKNAKHLSQTQAMIMEVHRNFIDLTQLLAVCGQSKNTDLKRLYDNYNEKIKTLELLV